MDLVELVQAVAPYIAAWHALYWVIHICSGALKQYKEMDSYTKNFWCTTGVSMVHSVAMGVLCVPFLIKEPNWIWEAKIEDTRDELKMANLVFLAYICNDLTFVLPWAIKLGKEDDLAFVAHHVSIIAVWASYLLQDWGDMFSLPTLITEVTGVFIGLRFVMIKLGYGSSALFMVNGAIVVISWWVFRIWGYVVRLAIILYKERDEIFLNPPEGKLTRNLLVTGCWMLGSGLQLMWGYKITSGAWKLVHPSSHAMLFGRGKKAKGKAK